MDPFGFMLLSWFLLRYMCSVLFFWRVSRVCVSELRSCFPGKFESFSCFIAFLMAVQQHFNWDFVPVTGSGTPQSALPPALSLLPSTDFHLKFPQSKSDMPPPSVYSMKPRVVIDLVDDEEETLSSPTKKGPTIKKEPTIKMEKVKQEKPDYRHQRGRDRSYDASGESVDESDSEATQPYNAKGEVSLP
jgi:hypothetical protein